MIPARCLALTSVVLGWLCATASAAGPAFDASDAGLHRAVLSGTVQGRMTHTAVNQCGGAPRACTGSMTSAASWQAALVPDRIRDREDEQAPFIGESTAPAARYASSDLVLKASFQRIALSSSFANHDPGCAGTGVNDRQTAAIAPGAVASLTDAQATFQTSPDPGRAKDWSGVVLGGVSSDSGGADEAPGPVVVTTACDGIPPTQDRLTFDDDVRNVLLDPWEPDSSTVPAYAPSVTRLACGSRSCDYRVKGSATRARTTPRYDTEDRYVEDASYAWDFVMRVSRAPIRLPGEGATPDPGPAPGLTLSDLACASGGPSGAFFTGFAQDAHGMPVRAFAPVGTAVALVGAACKQREPLALGSVAAETCGKLTAASTGAGVGALALRPARAGARALAGAVSLFTGLDTAIPCANGFVAKGGGSARAAASGGYTALAGDRAVPLGLAGAKLLRGAAGRRWRALRINAARVLGASRAAAVSLARARAAARAGASDWRARQTAHAALEISRLGMLVRRQLALQRRLRRALAPRVVGVRVDRRRARRSLRRLPGAVVRELRRLGASPGGLRAERRAARSGVAVDDVPRTVGDALSGAGTRRALRSGARGLERLGAAIDAGA